MEFGFLTGRVVSVSLLADEESTYTVTVSLPQDLCTSYNKTLEFKGELLGTAEVITDERSITERLFSPLRYLWKKYLQKYINYQILYRFNCNIPMTVEDWAKRIDKFLDVTDRPILLDGGHVSTEDAKTYAESEFEKYHIIQDRIFQSDVDHFDNNNMPSLNFDSDKE